MIVFLIVRQLLSLLLLVYVAHVVPLLLVCVSRLQQPYVLFKPLVQPVVQLFHVLAVLVRLAALIDVSFSVSLLHESFQFLK
jgi:hypothetical protein